MEPIRVFISSVMNRGLEDLTAERLAAREAIDGFAPIARVWAFESEPASAKAGLVQVHVTLLIVKA